MIPSLVRSAVPMLLGIRRSRGQSAEQLAAAGHARLLQQRATPSTKVLIVGLADNDAPTTVPNPVASIAYPSGAPAPFAGVTYAMTRPARFLPDNPDNWPHHLCVSTDPTIVSRAPGRIDGTTMALRFRAGPGRVEVITRTDFFADGALHIFADNEWCGRVTEPDAAPFYLMRIQLQIQEECEVSVEAAAGMRFYGFVRPADMVLEQPALDPMVLYSGDSWFGNAEARDGLSIPAWVAHLAGHNNSWIAPSGSTGYARTGGNIALKDRYGNDILAQNPVKLVLGYGHNDDTQRAANVALWRNQVNAIFDGIRAARPDMPIAVFGPFVKNSTEYGYWEPLDTDLEAIAGAHDCEFISPLQLGWVQGDGNTLEPNGSGNSDWVIGLDKVHPTDEGTMLLGANAFGDLRHRRFL